MKKSLAAAAALLMAVAFCAPAFATLNSSPADSVKAEHFAKKGGHKSSKPKSSKAPKSSSKA